jgi:hypothetical protein
MKPNGPRSDERLLRRLIGPWPAFVHNPLAFHRIHGETSGALLRRVPPRSTSISSDDVVILAIMLGRRRWQSRHCRLTSASRRRRVPGAGTGIAGCVRPARLMRSVRKRS